MACCRKSGVVSMTTLRPLRDSRMEGRRRLSRGSFEWQTRHGQPKVGTPIEVPEPSTVILNGVCGILLIQIGGRGQQLEDMDTDCADKTKRAEIRGRSENRA